MRVPAGVSAIAIGAMLLLGGCAAGTQLEAALHAADAPCRDQDFKSKLALDECLTAHERPVWEKDEPATLGVYDSYAKKRAELGRELDGRLITREQYDDNLEQLNRSSGEELRRMRQQVAGKE